jgi:hypothetical protein
MPKSARIWRNVTHQNRHSNPQYGDDDLIDVPSHVVVRGHSDAEHMSDFADELHARGHQSGLDCEGGGERGEGARESAGTRMITGDPPNTHAVGDNLWTLFKTAALQRRHLIRVLRE